MKIYLVRHGESTSDVRQRYDGDYDDHLTEKGRKEAVEIARKLSDKGIQIIFSSARIRAVETTEIIRSILKCKVGVMKQLNEQDIYGAYPGLSIDQPEEEYRKLGELLADRDAQIPGAETYQSLQARVAQGFLEIMDRPYHTVAMVTHGGPIRSIVRDILKQGELKKMSNGMVIALEKVDAHLHIIDSDGAIVR